MIPQSNHQYSNRLTEDITTFYSRTDVFKCSYFPYTILEWEKLVMQTRRSDQNILLKTGQPTAKLTFINTIGLKFLTRLKFSLSCLNELKFKLNFQDCVKPLCYVVWRLNPFPISFFTFIIWQTYVRPTLLHDLQSIDINILSFSDNELVDLLLYGSPKFNCNHEKW